MLPFASTIQFQALTSEGTPAAVRWHIDDPMVGTISQDGLLTTSVCAESRAVVIQATLLADTTQVAQLHTFGARTGPAIMSIDSITDVPSAERTNIDSVAGVIAVHAFLGQSLRCLPLRLILLEDGLTATPLDSLPLDPAVMAPTHMTITWDTKTVPNGHYAMHGRAFLVGVQSGLVTNTIPVQIRNP
jgi:hypothetical protein